MPTLDIVRQEIVEAALDVIGPYGRSKAERIGDRAMTAFRARGWEVFTWEEINAMDDTVRVTQAEGKPSAAEPP